MKNIDFLPADYHARTARRRGGVWRLLAAVAFFLLIAGVDVHSRHKSRVAQRELTQSQQPYLAAQQTRTQLSALQRELALAEEHAQVLAYLQHRWPMSQLLAIPTTMPPDSVCLTQVRLVRRSDGPTATARPAAGANFEVASSEQATRSAAAVTLDDLKQLTGGEVLTLSGTTTDTLAVQQFVTNLTQSPLVKTANLQSITKASAGKIGTSEDTSSQFVVQVTVVDSLTIAAGQERISRVARQGNL